MLRTYESYYYLVMPFMPLSVYAAFAILKSATGINVKRYKLIAFVLSAIYAGLAGSLFAHMLPGYVHPNNFPVIEMVTVLLMVVLGGIGNVWGSAIVTIVANLTRDFYFYQMLLFGLVIVGTVLFMPKGIGGIIDRYFVTRRFVAAREATAQRKRDVVGTAAGEEGQA